MVSLSASPCSGGGSMRVTVSLFLAHTHIHVLALTQTGTAARSGTLVRARLPEPTEKQPSLTLVYLYLSFLQFRFPERRKASAWLREAEGVRMITPPVPALHSTRARSIEREIKAEPFSWARGERRPSVCVHHTSHFMRSVKTFRI